MNDELLKSVEQICKRSENVRLQYQILQQQIQKIEENHRAVLKYNQIVRQHVQKIYQQNQAIQPTVT